MISSRRAEGGRWDDGRHDAVTYSSLTVADCRAARCIVGRDTRVEDLTSDVHSPWIASVLEFGNIPEV